MSNASDDEPEMVVIAQKEVVIRTDQKQNNQQNNKQNRVKDPSNNELLSMTLATNAVVDLGD